MAAPTLKSALNHYLQPANLVEELRYRPLIRPSLTEADRAHLKRWLDQVRDPIWEKISCRRLGSMANWAPSLRSVLYFIDSALRARHFAESQTDTPDVQRKRKQQREQQERSDLLALADEMEELVRHYQSCRKAQHPQPVPSPSGFPYRPPRERETKWSLEWLRRECAQAPPTCRESVRGRAELGLGPNSRPRQPAERVERKNAISRAK